MSIAIKDPEVLRQRLIETLRKRENARGLQLARPLLEAEDGEIIEEKGPSPEPPATSAALGTSLPKAPDPKEARHMIAFLHSKGLRFPDFIAQGLKADFVRQVYSELNLNDDLSEIPAAPLVRGHPPTPDIPLLAHPDLSGRQNTAIIAQARTGQTQVHTSARSDRASAQPPWLKPSDTKGVKRAASAGSITVTNKSRKRFGTAQHPTLVIDFDDSDGSDVERKRSNMPHKILDVEKSTSSAKLQKMEADIAAAMALINKAQTLHNARRPDTPVSPATLGSSEFKGTAAAHDSSTSSVPPNLSNEARRQQNTQLNLLQVELIENENTTSAKRKELLDHDKEREVVVSAMADSKSRQDMHFARIEELEASILQLRSDLTDAKQCLADVVLEQQKLNKRDALMQQSQSALADEIAVLEARRSHLRPQIATMQQNLTQIVSTMNPPNPSPGNGIQGLSRTTVNNYSPVRTVAQSTKPSIIKQSISNGIGNTYRNSHNIRVEPVSLSQGQNTAASILEAAIAKDATPTASKKPSVAASYTAITSPKPDNINSLQNSLSSLDSSSSASSVSSRRSDSDGTTSRSDQSLEPDTQQIHDALIQHSLPPQREIAHLVPEYRTSLACFRAFQFHEQYLKTVPTGYRSCTYFNKLKADSVLCKYETQGGICSEHSNCPDTHFSGIKMTGSTPTYKSNRKLTMTR